MMKLRLVCSYAAVLIIHLTRICFGVTRSPKFILTFTPSNEKTSCQKLKFGGYSSHIKINKKPNNIFKNHRHEGLHRWCYNQPTSICTAIPQTHNTTSETLPSQLPIPNISTHELFPHRFYTWGSPPMSIENQLLMLSFKEPNILPRAE